jgi:hypothetical protein
MTIRLNIIDCMFHCSTWIAQVRWPNWRIQRRKGTMGQADVPTSRCECEQAGSAANYARSERGCCCRPCHAAKGLRDSGGHDNHSTVHPRFAGKKHACGHDIQQ